MLRSVSGASHWNSSLLDLERVSAIPLLTLRICCRWKSKLFCIPNKTNDWTSTIMNLLFDEHLVMIPTMDVLSQCTRILLPLKWSPHSQSHGNVIQLSPVDAHEPILEVGFWEFALTPVALEVAAKAYVAGICEKLTLHAGEPMGLV